MPPGGGPGAAAVQNSTMLTVVMVISFCETHLIPMGHFHFRYHFRDVGRVCGDQTQQAHGGFEIYIYIYVILVLHYSFFFMGHVSLWTHGDLYRPNPRSVRFQLIQQSLSYLLVFGQSCLIPYSSR